MGQRNDLDMLKGMAIVGVVIIHVLTPLYDSVSGLGHSLWVLVNQVLRFSVPLFVAVSGYLLSLKYLKQPLLWKEYLFKRVFRVLPLFYVWVAVTLLVVSQHDVWFGFTRSFEPWQWILGRADYHLYFVPMIFQLYILFPFLLRLMKSFRGAPQFLLSITFIFQAWLYAHYSPDPSFQPYFESFTKSDQRQYIYFFSWIFYFVLGMYIAQVRIRAQYRKWIVLLGLGGLMGIGLVVAYVSSMGQILDGANVVLATRFTRMSILVVAGSFTALALLFSKQLLRLPLFIKKVLIGLGIHAYVIYLAHPLILRLIFDRVMMEWSRWIFVWGVLLIGFWLSLRFTRVKVRSN
jgi:probable poly-beta-1,6-N-acetyl-D-glucosamine export protein